MAKVPANKHQPVYQMPSAPNAIKTKKYALSTNTYVKLGMKQTWEDQKMWVLLPVGLLLVNAILGITGVYPNIWIYVTIIVGVALYVAFWAIQFTGITQLAQYKPLFEKYVYEIDNRQILMKLNSKEGGVMKWEQVKTVVKNKEAYVMTLSKGQFIYLPYTIFNSETDIKLFEMLLKRKEYLKG